MFDLSYINNQTALIKYETGYEMWLVLYLKSNWLNWRPCLTIRFVLHYCWYSVQYNTKQENHDLLTVLLVHVYEQLLSVLDPVRDTTT